MSLLTFAALTLPGVIVAYFMFIRPFLRALPQLKNFYARADGFWQTVWALCGNSLTIAFSYFVQGISWLLQWLDPIATALGDPDLRQTITDSLQSNPAVLGFILMIISAITIAARLHGIAKEKEDE